jgi:hypothetical protein
MPVLCQSYRFRGKAGHFHTPSDGCRKCWRPCWRIRLKGGFCKTCLSKAAKHPSPDVRASLCAVKGVSEKLLRRLTGDEDSRVVDAANEALKDREFEDSSESGTEGETQAWL